MMPILRIIFCAVMLAATATATASARNAWTEISHWIDKYPSDKISAHGPSLLDYSPIKVALRKILPKSELSNLLKFDVEAPVKKIDGYIVVDKCLPHNCPGDHAMIVMDLHSEKIWIGFFTREEHRVSTRWYSNAEEYTILPSEIQKHFESLH